MSSTCSLQNIHLTRRALREPGVEFNHSLERGICLNVQEQFLRADEPVDPF